MKRFRINARYPGFFRDQNGPVRVIIARPVGECLARARRRAVVLWIRSARA